MDLKHSAQRYFFIDQFQLNIKSIGWMAVCCSAIMMYLFVHHSSLNNTNAHFLILFSAALIIWIFRLIPESVPALFIISAMSLLDFKQEYILLSGFFSDSFFLTLSLFGIGFVLIKAKLFYRLSLFILYYLPPKQSLIHKVLFGMGLLMTPVVSVQSARIALMAPLLDDVITSSNIDAQSPAANALASSAFNGCILFSTIFLTGKSSNALLYTMLPSTPKQGWFFWLLAASIPGLLLAGLFLIMHSYFFKQQEVIKLNKFKIKKDLRALAHCTPPEWTAIASIIVLCIGCAMASHYHHSYLWPCLGVYGLLMGCGTLTKKEFTRDINWTFLFYFGALIGIMRYLQTTGIDIWLGAHLEWLITLCHNNKLLLIICVYWISWLCALILGTMTAPVLLFTVLLPLMKPTELDNWIVAFTILMATEAWVFPYQSNYFLCFAEMLKKRDNVQLKSLLSFNAWFAPLKLAILLASLPFWYMLGM